MSKREKNHSGWLKTSYTPILLIAKDFAQFWHDRASKSFEGFSENTIQTFICPSVLLLILLSMGRGLCYPHGH